MKNFYFLLLLGSVLSFSSCDKAEEGPAGPAGPSGVLTQGSISGKINGNRENGDTINESFSYNIYTSLENSAIYSGEGYTVNVKRRSLDANSYLNFSYNLGDVTDTPDATNIDLDFRFVKSLSATEYLWFNLYNNMEAKSNPAAKYFNSDEFQISNYSYNTTSGQLKFDFVITDESGYSNTTGNPVKITGSVDVNLKKEVYKKAAK